MDDSVPIPRRGRGAAVNPPNRFERLHVTLDPAELDEDERRQVATEILRDTSRSALSRNDSPDIPFRWGLNPYRGCEHACPYCLDGETLILMGDGTTRPLAELRVGDEIYGTVRRGHYRRYARTRVLAHWETRKPAYRVELADGTVLIASGDHRFLTERGWKYVVGTMSGLGQRPYLTLNNKLMGVGRFASSPCPSPEYRQGYLCGMIRGDGHLATYRYERKGRSHSNQYRFRLALADAQGLVRTSQYLSSYGIDVQTFTFSPQRPTRQRIDAIRTSAQGFVKQIQELIAWPDRPTGEWQRGFLSGLFDAEGSYSRGILRISNTNSDVLARAEVALRNLGFDVTRDTSERDVVYLRIRGGLREHLRFFHVVNPAIHRKRSIEGQAVKSPTDLRVVAVAPLPRLRTLYDITTGTGDFIANGVVSHNCFARPTHEFLGFSAGLDFETKIVTKPELPRLLSETFQKPSWQPELIVLSGNTDPYQPVERKLELTRRCLEVFVRHRNPVGIITKNALVLRDLDLLRQLAALDLVHVTISLTTLRDEIAGPMEPRASRPTARLNAIERLAEAGVPVGVNAAPLIPGLTDEELPAILEAAAGRGATMAGYMVVRLPGPVEGIFTEWLRRTFPDRADRVLNRIREARGGKLNESRFGHRMRTQGPWSEVLDQLFRTTCAKHGLGRRYPEVATRHFRRLPGGQLGLF